MPGNKPARGARRSAAATLILVTAALPPAAQADVVSDRNATTRTVRVATGGSPGIYYATVHAAIYDAVNAIEGRHQVFAVRPQPVDPQLPHRLYLASEGGGAFKRTDAAETRRPINSGLSSDTDSVTALAIGRDAPGTAYAITCYRSVDKTVTGGALAPLGSEALIRCRTCL